MADEVLDVAAEGLGQPQHQPLGLVELDELGGVARVDEVLQLAALHELVPAHQVEVDLVLLPLTQHALPQQLDLRQVLDALVQQALEEVHVHLLYLVLGDLPDQQVRLLLGLQDVVVLEVAVAEIGELGGRVLEDAVVDVLRVQHRSDLDEQQGLYYHVLGSRCQRLLAQQD